MKATITKITKGDLQIDVEVTYTDIAAGFIKDRVIVISEEQVETITKKDIEDRIVAEGLRYKRLLNKDLASLTNKEITF